MSIWFSWLCQRCGNGFKSQALRVRDCPRCASYGEHVLGRPMPVGEMGGE